jgi:hypothetical protein
MKINKLWKRMMQMREEVQLLEIPWMFSGPQTRGNRKILVRYYPVTLKEILSMALEI